MIEVLSGRSPSDEARNDASIQHVITEAKRITVKRHLATKQERTEVDVIPISLERVAEGTASV